MSRRQPRDPRRLREAADKPVTVIRPGRVAYGRAWAWQRALAARRAAGGLGDVLLLVEHPPVYTAGSRADESNLLFDAAERARRGIELFRTDRGGDFTYHGPGQLVGYPVLRLADRRIVDYVRALEEVNLRLAAGMGIPGRRVDGQTGVWVGDAKLTAIGVRVLASRVTQHGWATNVTTDLELFGGIVPCGIEGRSVCSLQSLDVDTDLAAAADRSAALFGEVFGCSLTPRTIDDLGLPAEPQTPPARDAPTRRRVAPRASARRSGRDATATRSHR